MRTDGIRLLPTAGSSRIPTEPLTLQQAGERVAEYHRDGRRGVEAQNADGSPLTAQQKVALLRFAMEAL